MRKSNNEEIYVFGNYVYNFMLIVVFLWYLGVLFYVCWIGVVILG